MLNESFGVKISRFGWDIYEELNSSFCNIVDIRRDDFFRDYFLLKSIGLEDNYTALIDERIKKHSIDISYYELVNRLIMIVKETEHKYDVII